MKTRILFVVMILIAIPSAVLFGQILSNGTGGGDWNTGSTWVGGNVPTSSDNVIIVSGDSVRLAAAGTCANLTMQANSKLALNATGLTMPGSSWSINSSSTVYYNGTTTVTSGITYGNLYYMSASGGPDGDITIAGDLVITTATFRGIATTSGTRTITINGNVYIGNGASARISAVNQSNATTASCTFNIGGNVTLSGNGNRLILFESAGPHSGTAVYNIDGNFTLNGTSDQVNLRSSTSSTSSGTGTIKVKGNIVNNGTGSNGIRSNTGTAGILELILNGSSAQQYTGVFPIAFPTNQTCKIIVDNGGNGILLNNSATLNTNNTFTLKGSNFTLSSTSLTIGSGTSSVSRTTPDFSGTSISTLDDGGYSIIRRSNQYWTLSHTFSAGTYSLSLDGGSQGGITDPANLRIIHSTDGSSFDLVGSHSDGSGTIANRTGISFSTSGRFYLGGQDLTTNPLPVEISSFKTLVNGKAVELLWNTATELNNAGFEIQRTAISNQISEKTWEKVGFVEGNGTTNAPQSYRFVDNVSAATTYQYRLKQIDRDGKFEYSPTVEATVALTAQDYQLSQNFPNPFNPSTTFTFAMKNEEQVTVKVFNLIGQEVATLFNGIAKPNQLYAITFNAKNFSSGVYFYSLQSKSRHEIKKMILNK